MKRFNSQSESRKEKRGHIRFIANPLAAFVENAPKLIKQRRLKNLGTWINA